MSNKYDWNGKQKKLALLLKKADTFDSGILLCLEMHNQVHDLHNEPSELTIYQNFIHNLSKEIAVYRPERQFSSIAWNIWHLARIEDAIVNILITNNKQVFDSEWKKRLNVSVTDTGNAFSIVDVDKFDKEIHFAELLKYRKAVGWNTQKVIKQLDKKDRLVKPSKESLDKLLLEGVLVQEKESIWLLDYWKNKTINGLLLMPITRHQIVHINDCIKIKNKYNK
jgi:hypothetical protein